MYVLWGGAFNRISYIGVQIGTTTNLFNRGLVVYAYWVVHVLKVASCTSVYKKAPKQTYLSVVLFVYVYGVVLKIASCTLVYK